jgi:hypothetical protein
MRDGQRQGGFRQQAEQQELVERFRLEDQGERVLPLRWCGGTRRLVALLRRFVALEILRVDAQSQQRLARS